MKELVELEEEIISAETLDGDLLARAKQDGFSDKYLAKIRGEKEDDIRAKRTAIGVVESWDAVPVSGVATPEFYYYSTYNGAKQEAANDNERKVMILGSGPNRIGQGIEFDYCCALNKMDYFFSKKSLMSAFSTTASLNM